MEHSRRSTQSMESARPLRVSFPNRRVLDPCHHSLGSVSALGSRTSNAVNEIIQKIGKEGGKMLLFCNLSPPLFLTAVFFSIHLSWWAIKRCYHGNARGRVSIGWAVCDENGPRTAPSADLSTPCLQFSLGLISQVGNIGEKWSNTPRLFRNGRVRLPLRCKSGEEKR